MPFAIITRDKPGHAGVRASHQSAHKAYLDQHKIQATVEEVLRHLGRKGDGDGAGPRWAA